MGVGPALPWRGATREHLLRHLLAPAAAMLLTAALSILLGTRDPFAVAAFAFGAFALVSNGQEFAYGAAARRRAHGEAPLTALYRLVRANNRRFGGYIAHMGVVALAVGVTASSAFRSEREITLLPGESVTVEGYTVRFDRVWEREEPHRWVIGADLTAFSGNRELGPLSPHLNFYNDRPDPITTPAVRSRPVRDLYVNLLAYGRNGENATISVIVEPLVFWIWMGGLIVGLGALVAMLPKRRPTRVIAAAPAAALENA
jgi:cytochrome c-type biogenesis protein CcmF